MKFFNAYGARKEKDRFEIVIRLSVLTVFEISFDISKKSFKLVLLNFGIKN